MTVCKKHLMLFGCYISSTVGFIVLGASVAFLYALLLVCFAVWGAMIH